MTRFAISVLSRMSPLAWLAAVAGIWVLPLRAVVVLTGLGVTGSIRRTMASRIALHEAKFRDLFKVMDKVCETMGIARDGQRRQALQVVGSAGGADAR